MPIELNKVARAMCCSSGCEHPDGCVSEHFMPEARAARDDILAQIEEPSEGMLTVAVGLDCLTIAEAAEHWIAMAVRLREENNDC